MNEEWGYHVGLPPAASSYASDIDWLMGLLHAVMIFIFVAWGIFFVYCLFRYRARDGERAIYHQAGESASFIPDGLVLAFEVWLILAFGIPLWASIKQTTPPEKDVADGPPDRAAVRLELPVPGTRRAVRPPRASPW